MTDFQKYLVDEYLEDYEEGHITRRRALKLIAGITGSVALANTLIAACSPPPEATQPAAAPLPATDLPPTDAPTAESAADPVADDVRVEEDDPDVDAGPVEFPASDGPVSGYMARPTGDGPFAAVLVCHENRGLTPHIEDVTRRLAKAGYVALAVDLLSREGGTASLGDDQIPEVLGNVAPERFVTDFQSAWSYLEGQTYVMPGAVGMIGFCFGGGVTWRVAVSMPELKAAVPFYGPAPSPEEVEMIEAPVLAIYGGDDERINASIPDIEAAMAEHGKVYEKMIYPGVGHAFHNDTGQRYNADAARDAWGRTLDWLATHVAST